MTQLWPFRILIALAVALGAFAQGVQAQEGGVFSDLTLRHRVQAATNPALDPGRDDARFEATTELDYTLTSRTRGKGISLSFGGDLRVADDAAPNADDGFDFDRPRVELSYDSTSPRLDVSLNIRAVQNDIAFLNPIDLVDFSGGATGLPDDFDDLAGRGTRTSLRYRLRADFDKDRPFSLGIGVFGNVLTYSDVTAANLVDSTRVTAVLDAGFALNRTTRLDMRLGYSVTDEEDGTPRSDTITVTTQLQSRLKDRVEVRGGLSLAFPEVAADRTTVTGGITYRPTPTARLSLDAGMAFLDGLSDRFVGRLSYDQDLSRTLRISAELGREISNNADNQTVLSTIAQLGLDVTLSPLSGMSFDMAFVDSNRINLANDTQEFSATALYSRQVTKDWAASIGVRATSRDQSIQGRARSEAVFVTLERSWKAKHR
ncbi:MAG: hypothetical protein AAFZ04_01340 [Pseudomonadota bacterium]